MYATFMESQEEEKQRQRLNAEQSEDINGNTFQQSVISGATNNRKLKYMSKISKGFKEGDGPVDFKKTFIYNQKLT